MVIRNIISMPLQWKATGIWLGNLLYAIVLLVLSGLAGKHLTAFDILRFMPWYWWVISGISGAIMIWPYLLTSHKKK